MTRKSRYGARGVCKVSTGCATCKRRHKKCDEARPACSPCIKAGWKCDFSSSCYYETTPLVYGLRYRSTRSLLRGESEYMEYFRLVNVGEFALFFGIASWRLVLLQGIDAEPTLYHAALAIGALSSSRYHPNVWNGAHALKFSVRHYTSAIQCLQSRLSGSSQSLELAFISSIIFTYIEFLLELDSQVGLHVQAGYAMLRDLYKMHNKIMSGSTPTDRNSQFGKYPIKYDEIARSMSLLAAQVNFTETVLSHNSPRQI